MASKYDDSGRQLRRLFARMQDMPVPPGMFTQNALVADPRGLGAGRINSLTPGAFLSFGTITDCVATAHVYRVQFDRANFPMPCYMGLDTSLSPMGVRSISTLQAGTSVLCAVYPTANYGVIICALPPPQLSSNRQLLQQLRMSTRNRVDEAHKRPLRMTDNGMIPDVVAGRPFDSTCAGEQGWISATGNRIWLDDFMAELGVDESCGITAFFHDQLLRIAGYNLQEFSACTERYAYNDQEEGYAWTGYTPYPWEQLGQFERKDPRKDIQPKQWQVTEPWNAPWEPAAGGAEEQRLQPWHREVQYHGYLGQAGKHHVCAPPTSPPTANTFAGGVGENAKFIGVYDHSVGLDGRAVTTAAKGISIVKRMAMPSPKRLRPPEQVKDEGDNEKNYKAAGEVGGGPAHKITGDIQADSQYPVLQAAAGVLDLHAYLCNYATSHAFFWHEKDWKLEQESAMEHTGGQTVVIPSFQQLATSAVLRAPQPKKIKIDNRYEEQDYYPNEASIDLLPDGGIVIRDGFGSAIKMTGGSIEFSAAGDIWRRAGRNVIDWAGFDHITRAQNSIDITATERDVRIKAQKNMQILAGNEESGGILIESRSPGKPYEFEGKQGEDVVSSGVMIRAERSNVVAWSSEIYLRTGGPGLIPGAIVLDAGKGQADIITHSSQSRHFVRNGAQWLFGTEGEVRKVNDFSEDVTRLGSALCVNGEGLFNGDVLVKGWMMVASGHITTEYAEQFQGFVVPLTGVGLDSANAALDSCRNQTEQDLPDRGEQYYQANLSASFYDNGRAGSDDVIKNAKTSLRSREQYRTSEFVLWEDPWQQMARLSTDGLPKWEEKPVECPIDPRTFPFPGRENFDEPKLMQQPLEIFEITGTTGRAKDRGTSPSLASSYEDPKFGEPKPVKLNEHYRIIRK